MSDISPYGADARLAVLSNGLRVVSRPSDGNVAYIGVLTDAGSRDDGPGRDGLAHFVEHTIFKGTSRRRGWQISNMMETVGGALNAYTSREEIMIYTISPAGCEGRAVELLADLVADASFPEADVERERGVVLEEINRYHDSPADAVMDEFDELFYAGHPLAHNILGYADTVAGLDSRLAREFLTGRFTPASMVVYCVAPGDQERHLRLIERHMGALRRDGGRPVRVAPTPNEPFDELRDRGNKQANTIMAVHACDQLDERRYALMMLGSVLGGPSMNSRLNREMREKRGLVYAVDAGLEMYSDSGSFQVYFGTEPDQVDRCTRIVRRELERLAAEPMTDRLFNQWRRQICGRLLVSGDRRGSQAMALAKSVLRYGEVRDSRYAADRIMALTPADVRAAAELLASRPFSRLTIV